MKMTQAEAEKILADTVRRGEHDAVLELRRRLQEQLRGSVH